MIDPSSLGWIGAVGAAAFASWQASRANKQTKGTGTDFARRTTDTLKRIEKSGEVTHELLVKHLEDHAASDLRRRKRAS